MEVPRTPLTQNDREEGVVGLEQAIKFRRAVIPAPPEQSRLWRLLWTTRVWLLLAFSLGVWEVAVKGFDVPNYLLPAPSSIAAGFLEKPGFIASAFLVTLIESLGGFVLAASIGIGVSILMARSIVVEELIFPYLNIARVMPVVAVAPLLIIWFGRGLTPMILVAALIALFPIVVNTLLGLRSADRDLVNLLRTLNATERQIFWKIRFPSAMPHVMSAFRISAPGAVIGALVGEFVGGTRGLGFLLVSAHARLDTSEVFVMVVLSSILGLAAYGLVVAVERPALSWHQSRREDANTHYSRRPGQG